MRRSWCLPGAVIRPRQRKRPPGYGRSARSRGGDCALGDDDRAGGVHRVHESTPARAVAAPGPGIDATERPADWYPVPVIPRRWTPVHRADGEHVGYLVPSGEPGLVLPVTLVGAAIGPSQEADVATALLAERGLAALDRRWWCRLPDPLPRGVLDAGNPPAGGRGDPSSSSRSPPAAAACDRRCPRPRSARARRHCRYPFAGCCGLGPRMNRRPSDQPDARAARRSPTSVVLIGP